MAFKVQAKIQGMEQLIKRLEVLKKKKAKKIVEQAVTRAAKAVLRIAKAKVPVDTGLARKSLGSRIKTYRRSGAVVGIVGPRSGFRQTRQGKRRTKLGEKFKEVGRNPTKYAHLIEFGSRHSPAQPFLRPARDTSNASEIMKSAILEGIEREA